MTVDPLPGERTTADNRAEIAVDVRKARSELLLLAGAPGWDLRFLSQVAASEDRLELSVVRPGPSGPVYAGDGGPFVPPRTAAGWSAWDGVVCVGWSGFDDVVDWASLSGAVAEGTGLLVLQAGEEAPPPGPLAAALPVRVLSGARPCSPPGSPRRLLIAPAALGHPLLAGVDLPVDAPGEPRGWLPPVAAAAAVRPSPGAETLLSIRSRGEGDRAQPVLVAVDGPGGRVIWFGAHPFWEQAFWRPPKPLGSDGSQPVLRLARNLLVGTATGDDPDGVSLAGHRNVYAEGERVRLEMRDEGGRATGALHLELSRIDGADGEEPRLFSLSPIPGAAGRSEVVLPPLPPGRYVVRPVGGGRDDDSGSARSFLVASRSLEEVQTRQDRRRLRELAAEMGGVYVAGDRPEAVQRLSEALDGLDLKSAAFTRAARSPLWVGWLPLMAAVLLLAGEWILRRRLGML